MKRKRLAKTDSKVIRENSAFVDYVDSKCLNKALDFYYITIITIILYATCIYICTYI